MNIHLGSYVYMAFGPNLLLIHDRSAVALNVGHLCMVLPLKICTFPYQEQCLVYILFQHYNSTATRAFITANQEAVLSPTDTFLTSQECSHNDLMVITNNQQRHTLCESYP